MATYPLSNKTEFITVQDKIYPSRITSILGKKAPCNLYAIGNLELLNEYSIGFCGSRHASIKGLETARDCAEQAVRENIVVISGNASGVDHEVHYHALKLGGKTILVLPEGINNFRIKKSLEDVWDWNRVLVLSQFEPEATWQVYRAMTRNHLIIALSRVMIVIEAGEKGGTLNAGEEALKMETPLYVTEYEDMSVEAKGNQVLLNKGARKLSKSRSTNRANMNGIFKEIIADLALHKTTTQKNLF